MKFDFKIYIVTFRFGILNVVSVFLTLDDCWESPTKYIRDLMQGKLEKKKNIKIINAQQAKTRIYKNSKENYYNKCDHMVQ